MASERLKLLGGFVEALRRGLDFEFNVNKFDHRLKLQKLVYLAKVIGVPRLEYNFSLYLRGPYSSELADDYYHLTKDFEVSEKEVKVFINDPAFKKFVSIVEGKDSLWLEIASTLIELRKVIDTLDKIGFIKGDKETALVNLTYSRKPFATKKFIKNVLEELKTYGLFDTS